MNKNPMTFERQRIRLEAVPLASHLEIDRDFIRDAELTRHMDDHLRRMVLEMRAHVWSQSLGQKSISFEFSHAEPLTWWDHFKAEHPRLCARLSPPKYKHTKFSKSVPVEAKALFPNYVPPRREFGAHTLYLEVLDRR